MYLFFGRSGWLEHDPEDDRPMSPSVKLKLGVTRDSLPAFRIEAFGTFLVVDGLLKLSGSNYCFKFGIELNRAEFFSNSLDFGVLDITTCFEGFVHS